MRPRPPGRTTQRGGSPADWRVYRPAIWLAMLGVAMILLISPPWIGAAPIGAAAGIALRIRQRRG